MTRSISALHAFRPGSSERYFDQSGNLRANSKLDFLKTLQQLQTDVASGAIDFTTENDNVDVAAQKVELDKKAFNAYNDYAAGQSDEWRDLGAVAATSISTTMARSGFARNLLKNIPYVTDPARLEVSDESNVVAVIGDGTAALLPHYVTDRYIDIPYLEYKSNPRVLQSEINRGFSGLVEKVYTRSLQGIGVAEDKYFMTLVRAASNSAYGNAPMTLLSGLTPYVFSQMRSAIEENGIPASGFVMGRALLPDLINTPFASALDPVSQYEVMRTGRVGTIVGFNMILDGFRPLNLQVMDPKEMFATAEPEYLGGFGTIGAITASPRDSYDDGHSAKGWFMSSWAAMGLANARGVQLARRV